MYGGDYLRGGLSMRGELYKVVCMECKGGDYSMYGGLSMRGTIYEAELSMRGDYTRMYAWSARGDYVWGGLSMRGTIQGGCMHGVQGRGLCMEGGYL